MQSSREAEIAIRAEFCKRKAEFIYGPGPAWAAWKETKVETIPEKPKLKELVNLEDI